jgi:hypothetical protein
VARWLRAREPLRDTYSIVGLVTDDGSTFVPAATLRGNVTSLLADDRPYPGSVLYVIRDAPSREHATHRALEHFEAGVAEKFWERADSGAGEVYFV